MNTIKKNVQSWQAFNWLVFWSRLARKPRVREWLFLASKHGLICQCICHTCALRIRKISLSERWTVCNLWKWNQTQGWIHLEIVRQFFKIGRGLSVEVLSLIPRVAVYTSQQCDPVLIELSWSKLFTTMRTQNSIFWSKYPLIKDYKFRGKCRGNYHDRFILVNDPQLILNRGN